MAHPKKTIQNQKTEYNTVSAPTDIEITIQRSRFIASLRRVNGQDNFNAALKEIAASYPKATHYCWAYRFNANPVLEYASDAGEPAGTAGRPILGALKKYDLQNTMAVVTRYYGGIKLGVKGLISAYGGATLLAVEKSTIIIDEPKRILHFKCSYDFYNILLYRLERQLTDTSSLAVDFSDVVSGCVPVPISIINRLKDELDSIPSGENALEYDIKEV
ncbi:MAG: YigZ family protein [Synergistaceae bacterium]|jgi:uncharacterized YigZ family protein|nr:YigZ family protein [Synergistaceae bacterium]